uniref:Uncharacterized protein n=1 Tax=Rhizophora mucronata TaxID=61149 RepID=A0A2P2N537_RHIMU
MLSYSVISEIIQFVIHSHPKRKISLLWQLYFQLAS